MSEDSIPIKGERLYSLAEDVANGECGEFVYCLQNGKFYEYLDGYWQEIKEEKLLGKIQEYKWIQKQESLFWCWDLQVLSLFYLVHKVVTLCK